MKISKFPLCSLILLGAATIYAIFFCGFDGAKVLIDGQSKAFIQKTLTTFLNDPQKAKELKAPEFSDASLAQIQELFKTNFGHCELKDVSILLSFHVNASVVTKTYAVTVDCEKKKDFSFLITTQQKDNDVKYFGIEGRF